MSFADDLKAALNASPLRVHYLSGWTSSWYRSSWASGKPVALILHHTAGAATSSQDPGHAGNQHGANQGQIDYVNRHPSYNMPASAFTLDRDGCVYVNAALPCYHAGEGSFRGTQWSSLGVLDDSANNDCLGVECVDKGQSTTFTPAMKEALAHLAVACAKACGWKNTSTLRLPRHKDWAPDRKVDIKYSNESVQDWIGKYTGTLWDGVVPALDGVFNAQNFGYANPQAYRVAARLHDLGFYSGTPKPSGVQGYPAKAVAKWQASLGAPVNPPGAYSPDAHEELFG
jgi:hypothetical protein